MTPRSRRNLTTTLALAAAIAALITAGAASAATEGRIIGKVIDPDGNPIEGVRVTVSAVDVELQQSGESSKKGKFTLLVLDASRDYVIRLEKAGFQVIEEPIDLEVGGSIRPEYTMIPGETVSPEKFAEIERKDKAAKIYNEGARKFGAGDIDGALESFRMSLAEDSELGLAHLAVARILLARDDFAGALPHAEKTDELVPEEPLSQIVLFDALWGLDEHDRALEVLDRMIAEGKEPDKIAIRAYNAGVHRVRLQEWDTARRRFEQALELDPQLVPAHLTLSQISLNQGDLDSAIEHATAYVEAAPDNQAKGLSVLYLAYEQKGDDAAAQAALDRMAQVDPEMVVTTFFESGVEHFNAGHNAEAMAAFETVLRADPDHAQAHYYLGLASASSGNIPKAKQYLARFLELAPEHPEAPVARDMLDGLE